MENLLVIIGSPRENGISAEVLKTLDKEGIWVYRINIKPCIGCNYCKENKKCFIEDDMIEIYKKIERAKVLAIITPIYFMGMPSPLKALIDRLQVYYNNPLIGEKKGFVLMIGERKNTFFEEYYKKIWEYTLKNIGVNNISFFLLGNIKEKKDLECYYNIIDDVKKKIEGLL